MSASDDPLVPYTQLAERLRAAINNGEYDPGERLPSVRQLAREYELAPMTVQRALQVLRTEGLVESQLGRGVFVVDVADRPFPGPDRVSPNQIPAPNRATTRIEQDRPTTAEMTVGAEAEGRTAEARPAAGAAALTAPDGRSVDEMLDHAMQILAEVTAQMKQEQAQAGHAPHEMDVSAPAPEPGPGIEP